MYIYVYMYMLCMIGWCPGGAVAPWIVDVTKSLRPGMKAIIGYVGLFNSTGYSPKPCHGDGCAPNGFAPEIKMMSRLVLYEHPYTKVNIHMYAQISS